MEELQLSSFKNLWRNNKKEVQPASPKEESFSSTSSFQAKRKVKLVLIVCGWLRFSEAHCKVEHHISFEQKYYGFNFDETLMKSGACEFKPTFCAATKNTQMSPIFCSYQTPTKKRGKMNQLQLFAAQVSHHSIDCQRYFNRIALLDQKEQAAMTKLRVLVARSKAVIIDDDDSDNDSNSKTKKKAASKKSATAKNKKTAAKKSANGSGSNNNGRAEEERQFLHLTSKVKALSSEKAQVAEQLQITVEQINECLNYRMMHFRGSMDVAAVDAVRTPMKSGRR